MANAVASSTVALPAIVEMLFATVLMLALLFATVVMSLAIVLMLLPIAFPCVEHAYRAGIVPVEGTAITTVAPALPAVPVVVTPVVYALPPESLNISGCELTDESLTSKA